jgi:hypothetical protein
MDWHSSGITTSVLGALKRGINQRLSEFGFAVCGGCATGPQPQTALYRQVEYCSFSAPMYPVGKIS